MKKKILIPLLSILGVIVVIIIYSVVSESEQFTVLKTKVLRGDFEVLINVTGEIQAENSVEIRGPSELRSRNLRIRSLTIQDIIPEGTIVDSGQWVATLDRSEADNSLKDIADELEKIESSYLNTKLDTTIQLRQLRDDLINLNFSMEEKKIALEQSQFEPPATIRQAQINLDKAQRAYRQAVKNYSLKVEQAQASMTGVGITLQKRRRAKLEMEEVLNRFDIYAPASGMVIYLKEWTGQKRQAGSEINTWDLTVATLPDLSSLISRTYVNEIDISKIVKGQEVKIGVDAFPENTFTGVVTSLANIGEQLPNTDAKVFEVIIRMNENDPILRPSMTTSNKIITFDYPDVLFIPLEALHSNDSLRFVYRTNHTRQIVVVGESNENSIIVENGLSENDELYLSIPEEGEKFKYAGLELMEIIKERKKIEEEKKLEMKNKSRRPDFDKKKQVMKTRKSRNQ